jgi:hypothetical protein
MARFRSIMSPPSPLPETGSLTLDAVRSLAVDLVRAPHFFVAPRIQVEFTHVHAEEVYWEMLHGRLLDPPFTQRRQTFEAWHVFLTDENGRSELAVLSLRLDALAMHLHVTRAIHCHAWEGYHAGDNVYLSRETRKWVRELVGTADLVRFNSLDDLRDEMICLLFQAVVGTSRLPLTSLEAPLPAFSLGELAYIYQPNSELPKSSETSEVSSQPPMRTFQDLVHHAFLPELAIPERAKLLETLLHATPAEKLGEAADLLLGRLHPLQQSGEELLSLLRTMFNDVALSPYTDLVGKTLALLKLLEEKRRLPSSAVVDFLAHLLRQLGRHLTAYDLVVFHHRGANYPDALFLDAVLKAYLERIERRPELFADAPADSESDRRRKQLRRRALRQGWLLRARYEGHAVPNAPTSEGENARILPAPHVRVPEEQITQSQRRTKRLFTGDPLTGRCSPTIQMALAASLTDLHHAEELRELGMALFLDRPLGVAKVSLEPDQTLLFSYEAFSRIVADLRLDDFARKLCFLDAATHERLRSALRDLSVPGIAVASLHAPARPALVSLFDARKVAADFVLIRNTRRTSDAVLEHYDLNATFLRHGIDFFATGRRFLILQGFGDESPPDDLTIFDDQLRPRVQLEIDARSGYVHRAGVEHPAGGLQVVRVW